MPTFVIEGDCRAALALLFEGGGDGRLGLGFHGISLTPARHDDLLAGPLRFRDYLMEGFVFYTVQAEDLGPGCRLTFRGEGSNRDRYISSFARRGIEAAGLAVASESDD